MNGKGISRRGDKKVPVRIWNKMVRSIAGLPSNEFPSSDSMPGTAFVQETMLVKNYTGADLPAWSPAVISGMHVVPSGRGTQNNATATFLSTPVGIASSPSSDNDQTLVVSLEQIKAGEFGMVAVAGIVPVTVYVASESHKYVATSSGYPKLTTAPAGEAAILWKEAGLGAERWALIRLGQQHGIVRGTFSGAWAKGSTKTVTSDNSQYTAKNYFAAIADGGTKSCAIARAGSEWILIAAEC